MVAFAAPAVSPLIESSDLHSVPRCRHVPCSGRSTALPGAEAGLRAENAGGGHDRGGCCWLLRHLQTEHVVTSKPRPAAYINKEA